MIIYDFSKNLPMFKFATDVNDIFEHVENYNEHNCFDGLNYYVMQYLI